MAKWSARVQSMPKPNTPVTVTRAFAGLAHDGVNYQLVHGRLRRRNTAAGPSWWVDYVSFLRRRNTAAGPSWRVDYVSFRPLEIRPEDEGITWCRGHRGPQVDRLAVVAALAPP